MDSYYYKFYDRDLEIDWQHVTRNSSDAWIFHEMDICIFLAESLRAKNISLVIYNVKSNEPIGICPLFLYTKKSSMFYGKNKTIAESFYESGPALNNKLSEKKRRELIRYIGKILLAIVKERKINLCRIASANLSQFCLQKANSYTNPWHEMRDSWKNNATAYYYLNLQKNEDQLKLHLETRARTIINKFEKEAICHVRKATSQDIDTVYDLFLETSERAGLPFHSKNNFEWFLNYVYAEHYLAFVDKTPACVIRLTKFNDTAQYAAGFTANAFIKSEVTTYALWQSILEVRKEGVVHFDLGVEEFKNIGSKADGIAKFKRSFGGELRYKFSMEMERVSITKKIAQKLLDSV